MKKLEVFGDEMRRFALGTFQAEYLSLLVPTMRGEVTKIVDAYLYTLCHGRGVTSEPPLRNTLLPATPLSPVAWLL